MEKIRNSFKITSQIAELTCGLELSDSKIYVLHTRLPPCFQKVRERERKRKKKNSIFPVGAGFMKVFKQK